MNMTARPLIQDLVKEALSKDARAAIAAEGARQIALSETSKEASAPASGGFGEDSISTEYAFKLAAAVEYAVPAIMKSASSNISGGGTHDPSDPPEGVSDSKEIQGQPFTPSGQGKGRAQPPMNPKMQSSNHGAETQMQNTIDDLPGGTGTQTTALSGGKGKAASVSRSTLARIAKIASRTKVAQASRSPATLVDYFRHSIKLAEDAINPASISAGPAVPPETSEAEQTGGAPAGGMPQGPRSLVHSNEAARNYKKRDAYVPRKEELRQYFKEPALTSETDKTLQQAFANTGEAGVKISSAQQVKTAAARALLKKLAAKTSKSSDKVN